MVTTTFLIRKSVNRKYKAYILSQIVFQLDAYIMDSYKALNTQKLEKYKIHLVYYTEATFKATTNLKQ